MLPPGIQTPIAGRKTYLLQAPLCDIHWATAAQDLACNRAADATTYIMNLYFPGGG